MIQMVFLPALTNTFDGRRKAVVLQTFENDLHSHLRGAGGGIRVDIRADAVTGVIIGQRRCCSSQAAIQLVQLSGNVCQLQVEGDSHYSTTTWMKQLQEQGYGRSADLPAESK